MTKNKVSKWIIYCLILLIGFVIGMVFMYCMIIQSFELLLQASNGIIQHVQVNFNETALAEGFYRLMLNRGVI